MPVSFLAYWWNGHLARILPGILVEWASCPYPSWHIGGMGILPVSCLDAARRFSNAKKMQK
ncbi:MAG: hypothetical protein F6K37_39565 [Moorea sp. SIO4E2]|uniref:hypothetical protein n=1 Tax=Moorena sp. SIO4E2 TaxID=2607826 RepID=UPI0013B7B9C2|nr:hypothetical protein [Moorena sp. SIO4E2]NEQ11754.1 hypothetical protein [Moorena sp. SIO4E2]